MMHRSTLVTAAIVAFALNLAASHWANGSNTAPTPTSNPSTAAAQPKAAAARGPLSGRWQGTWERTSAPPGKGTYTFTLTQTGKSIAGTIIAQGSACLTNHPLKGSVSGNKIDLHVSDKNVKADYAGTVVGKTMSGTATVSCSLGTGTARWEMSQQ